MRKILAACLVAAILAPALTSCVPHERVEVMYAERHPHRVWIEGHYVHRHHHRVWIEGHWEERR